MADARGDPRLVVVTGIVATLLLLVGVLGGAASAGGLPSHDDPVLWKRIYVDPTPLTAEEAAARLWATCVATDVSGVRQNASPGPRIGVLGDSIENADADAALRDKLIHWIYATHCGEKFRTALDSGRVATVMGADPEVVVIAIGYNDLTDFFTFHPEYLPIALEDLGRILDATDAAPCRVLFTIPTTPPATWSAADRALFTQTVTVLNQVIIGAAARPGVRIADWASLVAAEPDVFLLDGQHPTPVGINARLNLIVRSARPCWPPDPPTALAAVPGAGSATVWWKPVPDAEGVTDHLVELSDGRTFRTSDPILNVGGLTDGAAYRFRVRATNAAGTSDPSAWSDWFVAGAAGSRFAAVTPVRVLDTRDGTGGHLGAVGAGETIEVDLRGVVPPGTSAAVLNLTATGQTATTFVTAWPGDRPRPSTSDLNPRPGIAGVPGMVTVPVPADGRIRLYNNSGSVHLVADLVGTYGTPGGTAGSLYTPLTPTRLLDTREPGGTSPGPFGMAETRTVTLTGVPPDATAVVLNVTSTDTTAAGFVTLWPTGSAQPLASNLNPQPGLTRANLTTVAVGTGTTVSIFNNSASTALVVDLLGYYGPAGAPNGGAEYFPITPERHVDTRSGVGGIAGPVGNGSPTTVAIAGQGSVPPAGVSAIDANLTVVAPVSGGHTTTWPVGPMPLASNLNYEPGETVANRALATTAGGSLLLWSSSATVQYVVDVSGWFGPVV